MSTADKEPQPDRRIPPRYPIRAYAKIATRDGQWDAHVINISTHGALIAIVEEHTLSENLTITLEVTIDEGDNIIMKGSVVHARRHYAGLHCAPGNDQDEKNLLALIERIREQEADI